MKKRSKKKAHGALSTQGPVSWVLLSCLCTPQLADIILAALPGGVSAEVSTATRRGPLSLSLSLSRPSLFWLCTSSHLPSSSSLSQKEVLLLNHRFTMFHAVGRRPGSHCARFHGHWEALCVMWLKVSRPWAELPSFQWEAK